MLKQVSNLIRLIPTNRIPLKNIKWFFVGNAAKMFPQKDQDEFFFDLRIGGVKWSSKAYPDLLTRHLLFEGFYQLDVLEPINFYLKKGDTFIDVGGHHGLMAITAAKKVGETGKVFTFEPNPVASEIIKYNAKINDLHNVFVVEKGLSNVQGKAAFYIQKGDVTWNSTIIEDFVDESFSDGFEKINIEVTTLDNFVEENNLHPVLLKIDVEGAEFIILEGAVKTLEKISPIVLMEFNPVSAAAANSSISNYVDFFKKMNYELIVFKKNMMGYYNINNFEVFDESKHTKVDSLVNVCCLPRG